MYQLYFIIETTGIQPFHIYHMTNEKSNYPRLGFSNIILVIGVSKNKFKLSGKEKSFGNYQPF